MKKSELIEIISELGVALKNIPEDTIEKARIHNPWFTPEFIHMASSNWSDALSKRNLETWLEGMDSTPGEKKVGIIMAGNIPFVGLHDLLCVLVCGHIALMKLSHNDEVLMKYAIEYLCKKSEFIRSRIVITERLNGIDYLIATGSNNSSRYFEYYFKGIPSLIRKNRTSIAILNGRESDAEIEDLAGDIFSYFGLGCRNVTHLLLPDGIELKRLYVAYDKYMEHVNHHKYYNNYIYHKSILLMNLSMHYDNGFMLFQEKEELHAPIATLNYHFYGPIEDAINYASNHKNEIQCLVSNDERITGAIPIGSSQSPVLWDYADKINTLEFLKK